MRIDLILIGPTPTTGGREVELDPRTATPWPLGAVTTAAATAAEVSRAATRCLQSTDGPPAAVLHWGVDEVGPDPALVSRLLAQPDDVWHAGLTLGMGGLPAAIDEVAPTWMLNRDPDPAIEAASWRLSLFACLARATVIEVLGHVDPDFDSLTGAGLELGHRWINHGARMRHVPSLVDAAVVRPDPASSLSLTDEYRFVDRRYGRKWLAWTALAQAGRHPRAVAATVRAARTAARSTTRTRVDTDLRPAPLPSTAPSSEDGPSGDQGVDPDLGRSQATVAVLIPTVERYPSLRVVLSQLQTQTVPPAQVIVVDQTPVADRQPDLFETYDTLPLEVLTLEQAGQCTARNTGLDQVRSDLVLFIDDDDEIPDDLIDLHLRAIDARRVEVSSGVVHEPNGPPRSAEFQRFRVSDTFPTNNSMVRMAALNESGWFDPAFDRGDRADHDLGMRLYLSGARMVMDPAIDVLHNHAPRGGLRVHNARAVTYGGARASIRLRQPLSPTQIYLWQRYYSADQVSKGIRLHLVSGLFGTGSRARRLARVAVQAAALPMARRDAGRDVAHANELASDRQPVPHADGQVIR